MVVAPKLAPTEATRRWAALLRQIFEVDPLACPHGAGPMRIVACSTQDDPRRGQTGENPHPDRTRAGDAA